MSNLVKASVGLALLISLLLPLNGLAQNSSTVSSSQPPFYNIPGMICPGNHKMNNLATIVAQMPAQTLSSSEKSGLLKMREEEKLARDVYIALYKKWNLPIYKNISHAEQRHMDAVKALLKKYNIKDPVANLAPGVFKDPSVQKLYNKLVAEGKTSIVSALKVGATIEDLDISDLQKELKNTDNQDIKVLYQNLLKGSRNHMRGFCYILKRYGATYQPTYISAKELNKIITTPIERGIYNSHGLPMFPAGRGMNRPNRGMRGRGAGGMRQWHQTRPVNVR